MPTNAVRDEREAYLRGVDLLCQGCPEEAVRLLEPLGAAGGDRDRILALGKVYLELRHGPQAFRCFEEVLARDESRDAGMRAYLRLLAAAAAGQSGEADRARQLLEEVVGIDPRMEHAARELRRRIDAGRPPAIVF